MRACLITALVALVVFPGLASAPAWAHGDEELSTEPGAESGMSAEEAEVAALAVQPARVLAQQALALLIVRGDEHEAAVRLDAALESEDQADVDGELLRQATETLDGGDPEGAEPLLDQALSQPLGEESGSALHEAGREFEPATDAPEVVGIIAGALLALLGAGLLLKDRRRLPPSDGVSARSP